MTFKTTLSVLFISLFSCALFTSCGSDDAQNCTNWALSIEDELDAVTTSVQAYSADPTNTSLCQDYLDALNDYIDALDDSTIEACATTAGELDIYRNTIADARESLADLSCP